jgi:hypothetical protein
MMHLTPQQHAMLDGQHGRAVQKAMQILEALGTIYGAHGMIPVTSVQIAGVSYDNLGEAGLGFLTEMADGGGIARVLTTLNPAGMDVENHARMGISAEFAVQQQRVLDAFERMGVITTCTCTPYLTGNLPHFGEHIAWAESSAVCYANSVLGARTNREGGPSALASALTGFTPAYGLHLDENRRPSLGIHVQARMADTSDFGALGKAAGERIEALGRGRLPYFSGVEQASLEQLKALCASLATYGGAAMFHMQGITPEAGLVQPPDTTITITQDDIDAALARMSDAVSEEVDFVSLGCPHLSIAEIARIAELLRGNKVKKTFWITTARPTKHIADRMGYTQVIEDSGAIIAADTCCVVAPIAGRFHALATDSAKACYYAGAKNKFKTLIRSFDEVVAEALK